MACPHSDSDAPCPRCAATRDADAAAPTQEDLDGHTLVRGDKPAADALAAGARIGRYVVLEVLGAGGMGMVYGAYDPTLDRRVAIKVLRSPKGKGSSSTEGRARLLREAQAMAQLSHPNVVPVYDVGAEGNAVFVAMELVRGVTLDTWRKEGTRTWRELLTALIGAGRGLEAAHAAGLVHRDFKPTNVLMGEDGRPRVTDFGLARSTRTTSSDSNAAADDLETSDVISLETPLTHVGAVMGSPGYMAPEQYDGADTTPATDQYSFCVSLYEALYGRRPFQGADLATLSRLAHQAELPPPPKGSPVPAWLFPVVAKGLAADPAQRHGSMTALLAELSKDPVRTRRRVLAGVGAAAVIAAVPFAMHWLSERSARECRASAERLGDAWNDQARDRARAAFEATGLTFAQVSWEHARDVLDGYAKDWVAARVDACEAARVRRDQTEAQLALRLACLDRRLDELSTMASSLAGADAALVGQAPEAVTRLTPLAGCANLRALEARARLAPEAQETVARLEQQLSQGRVLVATGRLAQARERIEPAVAAADGLGVAAFQGEALQALGELEHAGEHFPEAKRAFERAAQAALSAGDDATAARVLAVMVSLVGWRLERPEAGLTLAALARGVLNRLGGDRAVAIVLDEGMGDAQWQGGDRDAALASYRRALEGAMALQGPSSADVARLRSSVGWVLMEQGHLSEARREYEASRNIREKNLGADHPSLGATWNELGSLAQQLGDTAGAVAAFQRGLRVNEQNLEPGAFRITRATLNIAEALSDDGRAEEASPLVARARKDLAQEANPPPSGRMQLARIEARVALARGDGPGALLRAREAVQIAEQSFGAEHPDTAACLLVLAEAQAATGRPAEGLASAERHLALARKLKLERTRGYADGLWRTARLLLALKRPAEAVLRLDEAQDVLSHVEGNEALRAEVQLALADATWGAGGDREHARALALEAERQFATLGRDAARERAQAWVAAHRK